MTTRSFYQRRGKRIFDVTVASALAVATLPIQATVAIAVRGLLGKPILFRQLRPGLGGRPFEIIKFRTMTDATDSSGDLLPDEQRSHPFGQLLRSTSLDELPELYNVIRGEMSLVGPRPLLIEYLPRYSSEQARRHEVRPGITGSAQVAGRNELPWAQRLAADVDYVDSYTFWLDCRIIARTLKSIVARTGISAEGHFSSEVFTGNNNPNAASDHELERLA